MNLGVVLPNYDEPASREAIIEVAVEAERMGYDSVWSTDHVLVPKRYELPYGRLWECLTTLAYVAGTTEEVSLGTSVLVLPARNPILVAKQVATLDSLSEGRAILGVGVGWLGEEFDSLNQPFHQRGKLADESIDLMKTLWTQKEPSFDGDFYSFHEASFHPKPAQEGGPPIWIGGSSDAAVTRASRLGDAYHPVAPSPQFLRESIALMKDRGRDVPINPRLRVDLEGEQEGRRWLAGTDETVDALETYQDLGTTHAVLQFPGDDAEEIVDGMGAFASEVATSFA